MVTNISFFERISYFLKKSFNRGYSKSNPAPEITDSLVIELSSKCKSREELAQEYGFSVKTLKRRFEKHNIKISSGLICPNDLRTIYSKLGLPGIINPAENCRFYWFVSNPVRFIFHSVRFCPVYFIIETSLYPFHISILDF